MIRSRRVANMAETSDMATTVHLSPAASGFCFTHFTSPPARQKSVRGRNTKKVSRRYCIKWFNPPLRIVDGAISIPTGPGVGLGDPREILKGATVIGSPDSAKKETDSN